MAEKEKKESEKKGEIKHRVRVSSAILDGSKDVVRALTEIKGIGWQVSVTLVRSLKLEGRRLGSLSDAEIKKLEEKIQTLGDSLPSWMRNRQKDYETGENVHLTGTDLELIQREDIKREKIIKSYRGIRHSIGLPVRGQRTRTSFRKGSTVGVVRKKVLKEQGKREK